MASVLFSWSSVVPNSEENLASIFPEQRGTFQGAFKSRAIPMVPRNDRPEDGSSTPGDFSVILPGIVYLLGSQVWLPFWRQGAVLKGPV